MSNTDILSRDEGKNLRGKNFRDRDLAGRDFRNCDLRGADFANADLSNARFVDANVQSTNFANANLANADLTKIKAGVSPSWKLTLLIIIFAIAALCGIFAVVAGNFAAFPFVVGLSNDTFYPAPGLKVYEILTKLSKERVIVSAIVYAVCFLALIKQAINRELRAALIFMGRVMAFSLPLLFVGAISSFFIWRGVNDSALLNNLVGYSFAICSGILAFVVAGILALIVAVTLGIAIATSEIIASRRMAMITRILSGLFAVFWALFGSLAVAFSVAEAGHGAMASALAVAMSWGSTGLTLLLGSYFALAGLSNTETRHFLIRRWTIVVATLKGTNFQDANLNATTFTRAYLKATNFSEAKMVRTCWRDTRRLNQTNTYKTYLNQPKALKLAVTGNGKGQDLRGLNLRDMYLQSADLSNALLIQTKLEGANLQSATFTGACIEDWKIDKSTQLSATNCDYVFMRYHNDDKSSRVPTGDAAFADDEFQQFVRSLIDTLDISHKHNFDSGAAILALKDLSNKFQERLELVALENKDSSILLRIKTSGNNENAQLEKEYWNKYQHYLEDSSQAIKKLSKGGKDLFCTFSQFLEQLKQGQESSLFVNYAALMNINKSFNNSPNLTFINGDITRDYVQGNKTDQSRNINNTGGTINNSGAGAFSLGDISGTVANTINQLPTSPDSNQPGIKELLAKLLKAIEAETALNDLDKEDALEEVQNIDEASTNNARNVKTTIITKSVRRLGRIFNELPDDSRLKNDSKDILPAIANYFNV